MLQLADSGVEESHQKLKIPRTTESPWLDDEKIIKTTGESVIHSLYDGWAWGSTRQKSTELNFLFTQGEDIENV